MAGEQTKRYEQAVEVARQQERWKGLLLVLQLLVGISMPFLLGVGGWAANGLLELRERVRVIEATRFTRDDAELERRQRERERAEERKAREAERKEIAEALASVRVAVAQVTEQLTEQRRQLRQIDARLEGMDRRK